MPGIIFTFVNNQVKASSNVPILPNRNLHLFSKKKKCDDILCKWQMSFVTSLKKGHYFLNFENEKQCVIKLTYAKGSS